MKLAKPQVDYYLERLRRAGIVDQSQRGRARTVLADESLREEFLAQVLAELPQPIPDKLPIPGLPGYEIDRQSRPWALRKVGRKGGFLRPDRHRASFGMGDGPFVFGYQFRVNGTRVRLNSIDLHNLRQEAERKHLESRMNTAQNELAPPEPA
jgi:hypothetical protein